MKKIITICLLFLYFSSQSIFAQLAIEADDFGRSIKSTHNASATNENARGHHELENSARGIEYIYPGNRAALNSSLNIEETLDDNCEQGDDSNGFQDGRNISSDGLFRNADDFKISADNTLNVRSIELNILSSNPINSLDFNFYNDENGAPGSTVVASVRQPTGCNQWHIATMLLFGK